MAVMMWSVTKTGHLLRKLFSYELLFTSFSWEDEENFPYWETSAPFTCMWFLLSVPLCTLFTLSRPHRDRVLPTFLTAVLDSSCGGAKFRYVNRDITCPPLRNSILHAFSLPGGGREWAREGVGNYVKLEIAVLSARQSLTFPETSAFAASYSPSQVFPYHGTCSFFQIAYAFRSFHPRPTLPILCLASASAVGADAKWGHIFVSPCSCWWSVMIFLSTHRSSGVHAGLAETLSWKLSLAPDEYKNIPAFTISTTSRWSCESFFFFFFNG